MAYSASARRICGNRKHSGRVLYPSIRHSHATHPAVRSEPLVRPSTSWFHRADSADHHGFHIEEGSPAKHEKASQGFKSIKAHMGNRWHPRRVDFGQALPFFRHRRNMDRSTFQGAYHRQGTIHSRNVRLSTLLRRHGRDIGDSRGTPSRTQHSEACGLRPPHRKIISGEAPRVVP